MELAGRRLFQSLFNKICGCRPTAWDIVKGKIPARVSSCWFCDTFWNVFFTGHLRTTTAQVFLALINSGLKSSFPFISPYWCIVTVLTINATFHWKNATFLLLFSGFELKWYWYFCFLQIISLVTLFQSYQRGHFLSILANR